MMASKNTTGQDYRNTHDIGFLTGVITAIIDIEDKIYMGRRVEYAPSLGNRGY